MSTTETCESITRQGRRCRNPAIASSDPPVCWRHTPRQSSQPVHDGAEERLLMTTRPQSLAGELSVVRQVLQRLVDRLYDPQLFLEAEELRKVAALIFSGARTVAYLLQQQRGHESDVPDWLDEALDALSADYGAEL